MEAALESLVLAVGVYLAIGLVIAAPLHAGALARLDPAARGAGLGFRLLITPGLVALWPAVARRWLAARGGSFHAETERVRMGALRAIHGPLVALCVAVGGAVVVVALLARPPLPAVAAALDFAVEGPPPAEGDGVELSLEPAIPGLALIREQTAAGPALRAEIAVAVTAPGLAFYWQPSGEAELAGARVLGPAGRSGTRRLALPAGDGAVLVTGLEDRVILAVARAPAGG
ncbi:MAG: hypothetical protein R3A51_22890 [Nannocystaceae bacterium]|nr:hypothetical protein [Myxococcales bacterium]